ncbi:MAG: DUF3108 domain-containing protein [Ignavibacteriales bacterium]|nr:DUF3108 domain-containing protein [Ignavibacteriales bacterium]
MSSIYLPLFFAALLSQEPQTKEIPHLTPSDSAFTSDPFLQVGEVLEYKVSYSFFNIGTIRIELVGKEEKNGRNIYTARAIIDSNPSLSWLVDLHIRFYSQMDAEIFSHEWIGDDSSKNEVKYRRLTFEYDSNRVMFERGKKRLTGQREPESVDTVQVKLKCQDGFTLFFLARKNVRQKSQMNIPTFIENKQVNTFINFMNARTDVDIDAVNYPVEVVEFDGKAGYVGVFGLTGGFSGWFSDDEARVPIVARMNVILGSIKVELVSWKRMGWTPPKHVEKR